MIYQLCSPQEGLYEVIAHSNRIVTIVCPFTIDIRIKYRYSVYVALLCAQEHHSYNVAGDTQRKYTANVILKSTSTIWYLPLFHDQCSVAVAVSRNNPIEPVGNEFSLIAYQQRRSIFTYELPSVQCILIVWMVTVIIAPSLWPHICIMGFLRQGLRLYRMIQNEIIETMVTSMVTTMVMLEFSCKRYLRSQNGTFVW